MPTSDLPTVGNSEEGISEGNRHKCNVNEIPNFFPLVQCINTPPFTLINISLDSVVFDICAFHLFCALFKFKLYFTTFTLCKNPVLSIEICSFCNI